jgi:XRE family aerobic/anaerobic benzoate catabolism transcriptional regulator
MTPPEPGASAIAVGPVPPADARFLSGIGKFVRETRDRRGIARRILAQQADISERYLAQLEAGEANASVLVLRSVARALDVPLPEMLAEREPSPEQRLVRRFLDELPAHRLEDVLLRLMRDYGPEEAARRQRIALVGLRGAGKTTLGKALAADLGMGFVELDEAIEREAGLGLSEVFLLYGQAGYRRIERRCLDAILDAREPVVLAVGGGIVSEPETYNRLLRGCFTAWIKTSPEEHMARVVAQGDLRPMAGSKEAMDDLKRILAAREPLYRKADVTIDTEGETPERSLRRLREAVPEPARA